MGLHKGTHRHRTEALDWRKIASLDLEKILEDPEGGNTLKEILPQIAYCQAELEFDAEKTDPGFRKVFQLSQIIIEHLVEHHKSAQDKVATLELKCIGLAQQTEQNAERIKVLSQKLLEAKRELKRRKELIVSGQTEILGRDNNDEFDQCPYCTKKFMTSIYLYAHLQRRHQGLPIHPVFNSQNHIVHQNQLNLGVMSTNSTAKPIRVYSVTSATQTEELNSSGQNQINLKTVSNLVETYLQQKAGESRENKLLPSSLEIGESSERRKNSVEEAERHIASMKEDLENQWKNLAQKIQQTGIEELKGTLIGEMHKMQDIITKTNNVGEPAMTKEIDAKAVAPSPSALIERVEERFQKQENELEYLRKNIQSKMHDDLGIIESKLESQERFWRCKLRTVEQEYRQQINGLREEVHASISQQRKAQEQLPVVKSAPVSPIEPILSRDLKLIVTPPKITVKQPEIAVVAVIDPKPVPKPRKPVQESSLETQVEEVTKTSSQKRVETPKQLEVPISSAIHEYEEPRDANNSDHVSDYSFSEPSLSDTELSQLKKKERQEKMRNEQMSQMDLVRNRVLDDMKHKMEQLGVNPDNSQLLKEDMSKVLGRMKHKRSKIDQDKQDAFAAERQAVKQEAQNAAKSKTLEEKIGFQITKQPAPPIPSTSTTPTRNFVFNEPKSPSSSKSPLVKMFNALKNCNIKKKMSFLRKKHPRSRLLIPNPSPRKTQKPSFFRRRGKKKGEKGAKPDTSLESQDEDEFSSGEPPTSSTPRPNAVLVKDKKRRVSRTNRQLSKSIQLANTMNAMRHMNVVSNSETEDEPDEEEQKKAYKSDTSSWKSSELHKNAKEAIKKSTIPIVSQVAVGSEPRRSSNAQLQTPSSADESGRKGEEDWDLTDYDSSLPSKNDKRKPSAPGPGATSSGSEDSENYERPITAVRREDHEKGQYVNLKPPEPKVIVYNKNPSKNAFGLLNNPYLDEPDFVSSTPVRNQDFQKPSTSKETPQTPSSSKVQPNKKAAAAFSAAPAPAPPEKSTSSVSDWDNTSDDYSGKRVEYPKSSPNRPDFVVHSPRKPAALPMRSQPQPVTLSPKKSPASPLTRKVTVAASPARQSKNVTSPSPLKKTPPPKPWTVSTVNKPPTAGTKNTKHLPSSAVQRK